MASPSKPIYKMATGTGKLTIMRPENEEYSAQMSVSCTTTPKEEFIIGEGLVARDTLSLTIKSVPCIDDVVDEAVD